MSATETSQEPYGGSPAEPPAGSAGEPSTEAAAEPSTGPSLETIQRELTAFARRARATAARMHPELSLVAYTILSHLEEQQGCRATDLAAHYLLDKSTVSRQVAALERLGFIERRVDPADHRVQVLHLAPRGIEILAAARVRRQESFKERLAEWDPADLARFADYLVRYNADAAAHP
ncbi:MULTISPECIES: MarR family winged helix-turn-helix transcriptional regulator [unclassified Streptomyces]|uniref:MarR family winged helix-turn-helix transcriptional regulator n=1 Tax=unclassified Streptomyces TaxID=2593676 RepID=UPI002E2BD0FB|nr:MarR family winged helix-turn-helix transcriptional regulator [Streptomyces sp. NBC_00223]